MLKVSDPKTWGVSGWLWDVIFHLIYGFATVATYEGVYEKVVGGGRRDPLQRVRAHDVPMGGWEWCNEARHGRPLDASPPALRSACLLASNFFIPPWGAGVRMRCRQANRRSKGLAGVSRERRGRASLHHPWAPHRHALVADALKLVPTHVRRFLASNLFMHPSSHPVKF